MAVKQKITELLKQLNGGVYEKEEVIALTLLSAIAGESIFLLGAPGVAKSLIARRLKYAFKDSSSFEYLMNRFSTPDEIFGPVSISKLKDEDKYERIVKNYLPDATVVFLDEIWKAGPSIQNALLTVLNEKVYRNGEQEIKVPMKALISASNELPSKGEGLEALWDRFLVRLIVDGVQKKENFNDMISKPLNSYSDTIEDALKITNEEYETWSKAIDEIEIPENVFNVIDVIRKKLQLHNQEEKNKENQIYISDRRWRKVVRLLRTSAFLNDRNAVDLMDCFLIKECLWNDEGQKEIVFQFVSETIQNYGYTGNFNFNSIIEMQKTIQTEIKEATEFETDTRTEVLTLFQDTNMQTTYYFYKTEYSQEVVINKNDFEGLTNSCESVREYTLKRSYDDTDIEYEDCYYKLVDRHSTITMRKGNTEFTFFDSSNKEKKLKTEIVGTKYKGSKKPTTELKMEWNNKINALSNDIEELTEQIENYKNDDLKYLHCNLFVNPLLADIVESHIIDSQKQIDNIKIEIRQIQYNIEHIENKIIFDLTELKDDLDEWTLNKLEKYSIFTSDDFLKKDKKYFDFLDNYDELKQAIQNKIKEELK
ncbi:MAG: AAA family ATPase [Candidatus Symbiothrix sp.]|jgi:MoxR-like ATPase|nr:AAA family ATPase [Candidatus Symbiothrix sp.]